ATSAPSCSLTRTSAPYARGLARIHAQWNALASARSVTNWVATVHSISGIRTSRTRSPRRRRALAAASTWRATSGRTFWTIGPRRIPTRSPRVGTRRAGAGVPESTSNSRAASSTVLASGPGGARAPPQGGVPGRGEGAEVRLQAAAAAEGGGDPDRPAGVGPEGARAEP